MRVTLKYIYVYQVIESCAHAVRSMPLMVKYVSFVDKKLTAVMANGI